ncbi:MAG: hypothetical protein ABIP57_21460 [Jatrophihabitantaceae bacterium]
MSSLSDLLTARLPAEWTKARLVEAMHGRLDRATVYKYLAGNHPQNPQDSVLQAFAEVLPGLTLVQLRAAVNQPVGVEEPWIPPVEANRLTMAQRRALEAFIKATVASSEASVAEPVQVTLPAARLVSPEPLTPVEQAARAELSTDEQAEVQRYLDQLNASGRGDLAERVAASLVINSASETASKSSRP